MTHQETSVTAISANLRRHSSTGRALLFEFTGAHALEVAGTGRTFRTSDAKELINFGAYATFLVAASHPRIQYAAAEILSSLPGSSRAFANAFTARALQSLNRIMPAPIEKFMLLNSGSEAVEAALKLARLHTGRAAVMHLQKSYHGKTLGALAVTDAEAFRSPFASLLPESSALSRDDADACYAAITTTRPAAVIVEVVQGEGGVYPVPVPLLRAIQSACRESGALFIVDEIQTGLGRTGSMWAFEGVGLKPDVVLVGKALGAGIIPVSVVGATREAFRSFDIDPLVHSSTYGGNPLACAIATAVIEIVESEEIPQTSQEVGKRVMTALTSLVDANAALLTDVTGRGLLIGMHFANPPQAALFIKGCLKKGVITTPCLTTPNVVRLSPPADLSGAMLNRALEIFAEQLAEMGSGAASLRSELGPGMSDSGDNIPS